MGAGASAVTLDQLSPENIGELVASMGDIYRPYSTAIVSHCVSGAVLASIAPDQMKACLESIGVTNPIHQNVLITNINKLKGSGGHSSGGAHAAGEGGGSHEGRKFHPLPASFILKEKVTMTPRSIMSELFEIQGIAVDPTDVEVAVDKLAKAIGPGFGDGKTKFDCFINYRVAADADLAEKLYLYLLSRGIHAFLDRKCLKNGEKWKDGFLKGLKNSKTFVALISRKALDRVRDYSSDHSSDNVLLEYETALDIMKSTENPQFICPLLVGECAGKVLSKFEDYSSDLYPDSVAAIPKAAPEVKKAPEVIKPKPKPGSNKKTAKPPRRIADSDEDEEASEPEGDDEDKEEGEGEGMIFDVLQPEGTKSVYSGSSSYYCEVKQIRLTELVNHDGDAARFTLDINARGDDSLGALDFPDDSILTVNDQSYSLNDKRLYVQDRFQCIGELDFIIPLEDVDITQAVVTFTFSVDYRPAILAMPCAAEREVDIPHCATGQHLMKISDYQQGDYEAGYICEICQQHKAGMRWYCPNCSSDKCFACEPLRVLYPKSGEGSAMERCWGESYGGRNCDGCGRTDLQDDPEFYVEPHENYDLCLCCACDQYQN